jgi:hypothetical protein
MDGTQKDQKKVEAGKKGAASRWRKKAPPVEDEDEPTRRPPIPRRTMTPKKLSRPTSEDRPARKTKDDNALVGLALGIVAAIALLALLWAMLRQRAKGMPPGAPSGAPPAALPAPTTPPEPPSAAPIPRKTASSFVEDDNPYDGILQFRKR